MGVVGWRKEAFQMNQFSISLCFSLCSTCVRDAVNADLPRLVSRVYLSLYCISSEIQADVRLTNWFERPEGWPCCIQRWLLVKWRAAFCTAALGLVHCLVRDFIRILYSLLTPSPLAIALYTTSHIPATNAFFYRSLPSFPPATVSERSIRNAGLPVVPVVWPLLTGGEEALIGMFGCLLYFDLWGPFAVPTYWQIWVASNDDSDVT